MVEIEALELENIAHLIPTKYMAWAKFEDGSIGLTEVPASEFRDSWKSFFKITQNKAGRTEYFFDKDGNITGSR